MIISFYIKSESQWEKKWLLIIFISFYIRIVENIRLVFDHFCRFW